MKIIRNVTSVDLEDSIQAGVKVEVASRVVTVTGPRGSLTRNFKHVPVDMQFLEDGKKLQIEMWFGNRKQCSIVNTTRTHILNMILGVVKGFTYKMRLVYSHFPINISIESGGKLLQIRNFLGEKKLREVHALGDVTIDRSKNVKDELVISGTDLECVSRTCALIHQICLVKKKDIRKFLDGIYVSDKGEGNGKTIVGRNLLNVADE